MQKKFEKSFFQISHFFRHFLLSEYQLGYNASEAAQNIYRAIHKDIISAITVHLWFNCFRNKDFSLEDKPRPFRTTKIVLSELKDIIKKELTTREAMLGILKVV